MARPITPAEAETLRLESIPDFVIESFNEMITKNLSQGLARFTHNEVMALIVPKLSGNLTRESIYKNSCNDIAKLFREAGWKVDFDRPGYNESYEPFWVFRAK